VAVTSIPAAPPPGYDFPHGLFDFTLANCTPGETVILTITYPSALPAGTVYWKYGPLQLPHRIHAADHGAVNPAHRHRRS
jgi:hypothetical protein